MRRTILLIVIVGAATANAALAQVLYGSLVGNVTDPSEARVPKATVTVTNTGTGLSRSGVTDERGAYAFYDVQAGLYNVKVGATGFVTYNRTGVAVSNNTVVRVDVALQVGAVSETVTVGAQIATLQTDRADVHAELQAREVRDLPLGGYRNYQSLLKLVPGVTPPSDAHSIAGNPMRSQVMNVNGASYSNNNTRIDGASSTFLWLPHITAYVVPVEAIEAVNIATNSFDAEQGLAGGAAIALTVKSGTNDLRGSLFEYHTNSALKAKNFFFTEAKKPKNILNMFGGTLGGPIRRNRLFFFYSFEGMRQRESASRFVTVPNPDQRAGDFGAYGVRLFDPLTGNPNGSGRTEFPSARIPASRISGISRALTNLLPQPSQAGFTNNLFASAPLIFSRNNHDAKINWNPSEKATLFGRYGRLDALVFDTLRLGAAGGYGVSTIQPGQGDAVVQTATVGGTYAFTPTLLLDGHMGYTRQAQQGVNTFEYGKNIGLDVLRIPGTNGPDIRQSGFPKFTVGGYEEFGNPANYNPFFYRDNQYQYGLNAAWTRGAHNLRWGLDIARQHMNHFQPEVGSYGPRGGFTFAGGPTALQGGTAPNQFNSWATFLLGLPTNFGKSLQTAIPMSTRVWNHGLYLRDQWQATRRLTVNLGLRWEYYPFMTRDHRGVERYDAAINKVLIGGVGNIPNNAGIEVSKKLFAPRVGLAYRLQDEWVLRAGYGISIDPYPLGRPLRDNYPVVLNRDFTGPNTFQPAGTLERGIPPDPLVDLGSGVIDIPAVATTNTVDKQFRRGYIQSFNFTLQRRLAAGFTAEAGYVATRSIRQTTFVNINAAPPGTGTAGQPLNILFGRTAATRVHRPYEKSIYNALQARLDRRFSAGVQATLVYTFSKSISFADNSDSGLFFNTPEALSRNRAVTGFHRPHNLEFYSVAELPFGRGKRWASAGGLMTRLAGGWQVNAVFSSFSGGPFTVSAAGTSLNAPGNSQTADQVKPGVERLGQIGRGQSFFDPLAFRSVTQPRFGTAGRNILRGPGLVNLDFGLFRDFNVTERWKVQFRGEAFNLSNTPHFNNPGGNVSSMTLNSDGTIRALGGFTEVTSARGDERQFRLALRISF